MFSNDFMECLKLSNLLRDGDALLVWHGVTLLGDDCPALLLLHHLALLLIVSLARENNQARNIEFLFQNMVLLQVSLSLCNVYSISCLALVLQHSGALLLTHGPADRLVHWNQTDQEIFFLILNFVTCLANRLWYRGTHIL